MKRILIKTCYILIVISMLLGVFVGCAPEETPPIPPVGDFILSDTSVELAVGDQKTLTVSGNVGEVSWSSDSPSIVSVTGGNCTALALGVANITAIDGEKVLSCRIEVKECPSGKSLLRVNSSIINYLNQTASANINDVSLISADLYVNGQKVDSDIAISSSNSQVATISNGYLTTLSEGTTKISATTTYNGTTYNSKEYTLTVSGDNVLFVDRSEITILTPQGITVPNVHENTSAEIKVYTKGANGSVNLMQNSDIEWVSSDQTIATVSNGIVQSVKGGNAVITAKYNGQEVSVLVSVATPIYNAHDMNTLALYTYLLSKEEATKKLSENYVLMNDIDYSQSEYNWIVPIASVNGEFFNSLRVDLSINGDISFFSRTWENLLGLAKAKVDSATVLYTLPQGELDQLQQSERAKYEFKGINPNNVAFSGTFDGNGYSIKNAWLLCDNVQYTGGKTFGTGALSFIGNLTGTLKNLAFENLMIGDNNVIIDYFNSETAFDHVYNKNGSQLYSPDDTNALYATYEKENVDGSGSDLYMKAYNGIVGARVGRDQWGRRNASTSALVLRNSGIIENVYMSYTNTASECNVISAISLYNAGVIKDCVLVPVLDEYNDAACFDQGIGNPVCYTNVGKVQNVAVCHKYTTKQNYSSIFENQGETSGMVTYKSFELLKSEPAYSAIFNPKYWDSTEMMLIKNANQFN